MRPAAVRAASLLRGLVAGGALVSASAVYAAGVLPASARLVLPRLATVTDLRPGVLLIRDGAGQAVVEDNAVPDE